MKKHISARQYFKILFSALLLSLSGCFGFDENSNKKISLTQLIQQGDVYFSQHQYKASMIASNNAISMYPDNIEGYLQLANSYIELGNNKQAISLLDQYADKVLPITPELAFLKLKAYINLNKGKTAKLWIKSNSELLSTQPDRLNLLSGLTELSNEKAKLAAKLFNQIDPKSHYFTRSLIGKAKSLALQNDLSGAYSALDEVTKIDPNNIESLILKSFIQIQRKQYVEAENTLTYALPLLPSSDIFTPQRIVILETMIKVLSLQGRSAESTLYSQILATELPGSDIVKQNYQKALNAYEANDLTLAKSLLEDIVNNYPNFTKAPILLGIILYSEGDIQGANKHLARVVDPEINSTTVTQVFLASQIKLNKTADILTMLDTTIDTENDFGTLALYSIAALDQNKLTKAKEALNKMQTITPESSQLAYLKSRYYTSITPPDYQKSVQILTKALEREPTNQSLQKAYIGNLLVSGEQDKADAYVVKLQANKPSIEQLLLIAKYKTHRSDFSEAEQILHSILDTSPTEKDALYTLAKVYQQSEKWEELQAIFKKIISLEPNILNGYFGLLASAAKLEQNINSNNFLPENANHAVFNLALAKVAYERNHIKQAEEYIAKVNEDLPSKLSRYIAELQMGIDFKSALIALQNNDLEKARSISIANIKHTPDSKVFYHLLVTIELKATQYREAEKIIAQIESLFPKSRDLDILKGNLLFAQNDFKGAARLYLTSWNKKHNERLGARLYTVYSNFDKSKASSFLTQWLNSYPNSISANLTQALELQSQDKMTAALNAYEKVIELDPNNVISLNNAAWLYLEADINKALVFAEMAYKLAPQNPNILDTYGWILFKKGDIKKAELLVNKALEIKPDDINIKSHLIDIQTL